MIGIKNKKPKLGFSLVELSVVLTAIAILMIAVIKGGDMISQAKLAAAAQKTANSPVLKINGLALWYETTLANAFLSAEVLSGGPVSTWNDNSGYSPKAPNNALQATLANQPIYTTNAINGLPVLMFNGVPSFMTLPTAAAIGIANSGYEIFIVYQVQNNSQGAGIQFLLAGGTVGYYEIEINGLTTTPSTGIRFIVNNTFPYADAPTSNPLAPHIASLRVQYQNNTQYAHIDGGADATGNANAMSISTGLVIGERANSSYFLYADIAEIIIFNRTLTLQERQDVERYLSDKYNITLSYS